ncbi:E3 ubiquitin-protein ligase RNF181-like [Cucurbita moschata]|uniref:RING-type E3 ubiquitin transferase n=1 Tax=Cucurbita moschata TaxID=3662 RepID=A0A6J1GCB1_CUCMO|nr:E3 ubiquitin-protein ligase RNF181-like [Cucurbita moschata]
MASDSNSPEISSVFDTLIGNRDLSLFMPVLFGFSAADPLQQSQNPADPDRQNANRSDRIFLVNPFTQSMVVIEGRSSLEALMRDLGGKDGQPPASRASIEALPTVQIMAEESGCECVICLDEWKIGAVAKELPCGHKFHPDCIEKWLGIHGNCPLCRCKLPDDVDRKNNEGRRAREIWVGFSFNNDRRSEGSNGVSSDHGA